MTLRMPDMPAPITAKRSGRGWLIWTSAFSTASSTITSFGAHQNGESSTRRSTRCARFGVAVSRCRRWRRALVPAVAARDHHAMADELVRFDAVRVATDDLARATRDYALLLSTEPEPASRTHDHVRFALARGAVELVPGVPGRQ